MWGKLWDLKGELICYKDSRCLFRSNSDETQAYYFIFKACLLYIIRDSFYLPTNSLAEMRDVTIQKDRSKDFFEKFWEKIR